MQIQAEQEWPIHIEAIGWVNRLVIDLEIQLLGHEPSSPITLERLKEWDLHRQDLGKCKRLLKR